MSDRARGLQPLQPRGYRWENLCVQRPELNIGLPRSHDLFLDGNGLDPKEHFSKLTFSGSHEASILAVANKKVDVASTNLPDIQQMTSEGKIPRELCA